MDKKIFSPSAIKTFSECPLLYELKYIDRWERKEADRAWHARVAGDAFAVGSAAVHGYLKASVPINVETAVKQTLAQHTLSVNAFLDAGGTVVKEEVLKVQQDLEHAIRKYCATHPLGRWTILEVEYTLPEKYGKPRLDLIGRDQNGILSFADVKFKRYLTNDYLDRTVEGYRYDWQFLQYAWALADH